MVDYRMRRFSSRAWTGTIRPGYYQTWVVRPTHYGLYINEYRPTVLH